MDKLKCIWRLLKADGYFLAITNNDGADAMYNSPEDLEGSLLLAVITLRGSNMLSNQIEEKATELGDLRTMEALKGTIDRIAP